MNKSLSANARIVLSYIKEHPGITQTDIIEHLGMHPSQIVIAVMELEDSALLVSHHDSIDFAKILITYYPT